MSEEGRLAKFAAYGIELEYMIVAADSLMVQPIADKLLSAMANGEMVCYVCGDLVAWSNELVLHVIEAKTNGPQRDLQKFMGQLQDEIRRVSAIAREHGCLLLPTAMHPFFAPGKDEVCLWPHEDAEIYATYNRIFNCQGHGWANLQSLHINLPFANDDEFARVHTAVRLVLPLIAPLAASSPVVEGRLTGYQDNRLRFYKENQKTVPSIIGHLVPELVLSRAAYERDILKPIYRDIAPFDPEGIVQNEWLNSRGAIARFMRGAIEIRLVDIQECARADLALASLVISLVQALDEELFAPFVMQQGFTAERLHKILKDGVVGDGERIEDADYLKIFGCSATSLTFRELWREIYGRLVEHKDLALAPWRTEIETLLARGNLSSRLQRAIGPAGAPSRIIEVSRELASCLVDNRFFM